jgi:hypothetical protein
VTALSDPLEGANCGLCGATADNFRVSDALWESVGLGPVQACFKCFRIAAWYAGVRPSSAWEVSLVRNPAAESGGSNGTTNRGGTASTARPTAQEVDAPMQTHSRPRVIDLSKSFDPDPEDPRHGDPRWTLAERGWLTTDPGLIAEAMTKLRASKRSGPLGGYPVEFFA